MYVIEVPNFSLDQTYNSGQNLRWIKLRENKYVVPFGGKAINAEQQKERLVLGCNEQDFYDVWYHYFALDVDYSEINYKVGKIDPFIKKCANRGNGIHIIRQDLYEVLLASTIPSSVKDNINIARDMMGIIADACGNSHKITFPGYGVLTWHEIPKPEEILENQDKFSDYKRFTSQMLDLCQDLYDGWFTVQDLYGLSYKELHELLSQYGMLKSQIDRVCMYAFGMQLIPDESNIDDVFMLEFGMNEKEFFEWYGNQVEGYESYLYQYILHHKANPPKEVMYSWVR